MEEALDLSFDRLRMMMGIHRLPREVWYMVVHKYLLNVGLLSFTRFLEFESVCIHTVSVKFGLCACRKVPQIWICGHSKYCLKSRSNYKVP